MDLKKRSVLDIDGSGIANRKNSKVKKRKKEGMLAVVQKKKRGGWTKEGDSCSYLSGKKK